MSLIDYIQDKVQRHERLSDDDALALFESADLLAIGTLADVVNRRRNHDQVFFNVNRHINPTNICALSCKFCAYSRKPGEEGAYAYSIDEMVAKAGEAVAQGATEVHMVGGLHPRWSFSHYKEMIAAVKTAYPAVHIKAFTAVELDWLARRARKSILAVLEELRDVGLGSLPGGGAEIFHPEIRDAICDTKVSAEAWLNTHRLAHNLGMKSNCTMLYGHIEHYTHRVDHLRRLRELQDETHGFNAFIPLSFQPFQNEMGIDRYTFGYDDLKTLAIARLYLDNFQHIKAYWVMLGQDVAQLALQFGANDLDGTIIEEKISRMAGGRAGMAMGRSVIENIVRKARRIPQERDTLYNPVRASELPRSGATVQASTPTIDSMRSLINKLEYEEALSEEEMSLVAMFGHQHDLGRLAARQRDLSATDHCASFAYTILPPLDQLSSARGVLEHIQHVADACYAKYKLAPTTIAFDLALFLQPKRHEATGLDKSPADEVQESGMTLVKLLELIWSVAQSHSCEDIAVWGLKSLWRLAQQESVAIAEIASRLRDAGVSCIESSPLESETDLTHSEVIAIHRQIHRCGLPTVAKVELSAPTLGSGEPLWETFVRRMYSFAELATKTQALKGLNVVASPESFVTAVEYMRAVAIARLTTPALPNIVAPIAYLPTMSPVLGIGSSELHQPAEKIAAISLLFGANDLGHVIAGRFSPRAVSQQIRSAGLTPIVRDAALSMPAPANSRLEQALEMVDDGKALRHVPELRA